MNEKINLTKADGAAVQADVICFLEDTTSAKRYLYYTLNEVDAEGKNVKIYVAKIKQNDTSLDTPISEEEWNKLKGVMGEALKDTPNATIKYLPLTDLTDPMVVNDRVIAMPISYDYVNKHRGVYAQTIATTVTEPAPAPSVEETVPASEPQTNVETVPQSESPIVEPTNASVYEPAWATDPTAPIIPPVIEDAPVVSPTPSETPAPTPEVIPQAPLIEQKPVVSAPIVNETELKPIDVTEIEKKYEDFIAGINKLKEQELEAAKRYNATLELSAMHNEQHAEYVANEKNNDVNPASTPSVEQPISTPIIPETPGLEPIAIEPTPVTVSAPTPASTPANLETNWFDMPVQE